jgi:hypothetical protein
MRRLSLLVVLMLLACCSAGTDTPFTLSVAPEFVQGVIPEERLVLLVTIEEQDGPADPVEITATADAGEVTVEPSSIKEGEVAEVTYVADPVSGESEVPFTVTVEASRGSLNEKAEVASVVVPWEDTISGTAGEILGVFTEWLAENEPDLGITPESEFAGTVVAPQLLVVTHYAFFDETWEIGLSWHIMVAPDDWSQIYLRPRAELAPTRAFQLDSWSNALAGQPIEIVEIPPPGEVTR